MTADGMKLRGMGKMLAIIGRQQGSTWPCQPHSSDIDPSFSLTSQRASSFTIIVTTLNLKSSKQIHKTQVLLSETSMASSRTISLSMPIAADPAKVFATITDLRGYNTWLPPSDAFKGTTDISDGPIAVGTRYVEPSPNGTRYGTVTALDAAGRRVRFHQPLRAWPEMLGVEIDIQVDMRVVDGAGGGSVVEREVVLGIPWMMRPMGGFLEGKVEAEGQRVLGAMKKYLEGKPTYHEDENVS